MKETMVHAAKRCPYCEGRLVRRVPEPKHVEMVGSMAVTDGTARVLQCTECGKYDLSATQLIGYERRAAAIALREGTQQKITGAVVRYARKALGLRQADLAILLNVASETVSRWESAEEGPAIDRSTQLAIVALLDGVINKQIDIETEVMKARAGKHGSGELQLPERRRDSA
jgi:DNA-binding transcriptional regulator YiaG